MLLILPFSVCIRILFMRTNYALSISMFFFFSLTVFLIGFIDMTHSTAHCIPKRCHTIIVFTILHSIWIGLWSFSRYVLVIAASLWFIATPYFLNAHILIAFYALMAHFLCPMDLFDWGINSYFWFNTTFFLRTVCSLKTCLIKCYNFGRKPNFLCNTLLVYKLFHDDQTNIIPSLSFLSLSQSHGVFVISFHKFMFFKLI